MPNRSLLGAVAIAAVLGAAALGAAVTGAWAFDDSRYPDFRGQWRPIGGPMRFDTVKAWGQGQGAPLIPEYQAIFEANLADQAAGGQGTTPTFTCISPGMPRVTNGYGQMEIVITPQTTHVLVQHIHDNRRIFTDGRDFPATLEPALLGTSIGRWIDTTGSGQFDLLEVETRAFKGPRAFDASGLPLAFDNQSIFRERFHLDRSDPEILHDEVTVIDHALTRPWSVDRRYMHNRDLTAQWPEGFCVLTNVNVMIGKENYIMSADGFLMPTKKDQSPPDLRYFKPPPQR